MMLESRMRGNRARTVWRRAVWKRARKGNAPAAYPTKCSLPRSQP